MSTEATNILFLWSGLVRGVILPGLLAEDLSFAVRVLVDLPMETVEVFDWFLINIRKRDKKMQT